ncbi:MAG TPA: pectin acetylesterase-family hydrolase [Polyangiaceae bacterium]|nr:pectin acetylesterase-family hydrolase [Polyangiaceae bacterium]
MNELGKRLGAAVCFVGTVTLVGCSSDSKTCGRDCPLPLVDGGSADDGGGGAKTPGFSASAVAELTAAHVDKYVGKASLSNTMTNPDGDTVYNFDPKDGPVCYLGDPYDVVVHDAGSDNLLIFLQGGGACWSTLCSATSTAQTAVLKTGILNEDPSTNVVGGWNIVYAPYCDGSVFSGDNDTTAPDGTTAWHFHGLANLTAAIDVAKKNFPNPKRILLAGTSGGGYGTLIGTGVTRLAYPHTQIDVFNDAGLGLSNPNDPSMLATIKADWKFEQFIPKSCTECQTGEQTAVIGWGLGADPTLHVSGFSSYGDGVIGGVFLKLPPAEFKPLLLSETGKVHDAYPTRFERFFINGTQHTVLLSALGNVGFDTPVDGISVNDFTKAMLDASPTWTDHLQADTDGGS